MSEEGEKYKFEYRHFRPPASVIRDLPNIQEYKCRRYMRGVTPWKPQEHGGATLCLVFSDGDENDKPLAWGLAFCCMKDNFSYRLGKEIARGRALAALKGGKPKYFNGYKLSGIGGTYTLLKLEVFSVPAQRH